MADGFEAKVMEPDNRGTKRASERRGGDARLAKCKTTERSPWARHS